MSALTDARIAELLGPYLPENIQTNAADDLIPKLSSYLDMLLKWNAKTNLTAVREPEEIVRRHFGESLFAGAILAESTAPDGPLLDFGSGAGFPGLPIQLLLPQMKVCLAESQGKKAAFLREAVRALGLPTEVWAARVESMPRSRQFQIVTLRAVDNMEAAIAAATERVAAGGRLAVLAGESLLALKGWEASSIHLIPDGKVRQLVTLQRADHDTVPRGTFDV